MTNSILFCTPCYGGMATTAYVRSVLMLRDELDRQGMEHDFLIAENESLVHRGRMEIAALFLKTDHSHMMSIDADIDFQPKDVAALWNMGVDIAVAAYPMKLRDGSRLFAAWKDGGFVRDLDQFDGPTEVDLAGTGFMLISRNALETVAATAPSYQGMDGRVPAIFMTPIYNDGLESEDYHFCRIAREAGFKIMMDPSVRLGHIKQVRL
jgi:hypothetical protein